MNLEQLKEQKKLDMVMRMQNAMYESYFGGDTLVVKNINIIQQGEEFGLKPEVKNQYFTSNELEFIERENILDFFKKDWDIEIQKNERVLELSTKFEDVEWLFRAIKK